ncbi:MAG: hypothetical protein JWL84_284 [Rhodospirillales bacterium]|nr:hypothetical protein [Rhodospirillales bacterium]
MIDPRARGACAVALVLELSAAGGELQSSSRIDGEAGRQADTYAARSAPDAKRPPSAHVIAFSPFSMMSAGTS